MTEIEQKSSDDHGGGHGHGVHIVVDGNKHEVRAGQWLVSELKAAVGVPAEKVLAEITPHGLKDLEDSERVAVHDGQRFMSHVRTGGSS